MNKVFTLKDVKEILFKISNRAGLDCSHIPVRISTRMKSTYGAFVYKKVNGNIVPIEFRFQDKLLSGDYDEETVISTIEHEYVHFLTNVSNNYDHGHDFAFKTNCERLGVNPSTYFTGHHQREVKDGYKLFCSKCNNLVGTRRRKDAAINIANKYLSGCCKSKMKIVKDKF